jgi:hypothetical protein
MFSGGRNYRHFDSEQAYDQAIGIINIQSDYPKLYEAKENWCATIPALARYLRANTDLTHFCFPTTEQGEHLRLCLERLSTKIYGEFPAPLEILAALNVHFLTELPDQRAQILSQFHVYLSTQDSPLQRAAFSDSCLAGQVEADRIRYQDPTALPGFQRLFGPDEWISLSMDLTNFATAQTVHQLDADAAEFTRELERFRYPVHWKADQMSAHEDMLYQRHVTAAAAAGLPAMHSVDRFAWFKNGLDATYKDWIRKQQLKSGISKSTCTKTWMIQQIRDLQQRRPALVGQQHRHQTGPMATEGKQPKTQRPGPRSVVETTGPELQDIQLECRECKAKFTFEVGEQQFYKQKGLARQPMRCESCRSKAREKRNLPCNDFKNGGCAYGDRCRYQHGDQVHFSDADAFAEGLDEVNVCFDEGPDDLGGVQPATDGADDSPFFWWEDDEHENYDQEDWTDTLDY